MFSMLTLIKPTILKVQEQNFKFNGYAPNLQIHIAKTTPFPKPLLLNNESKCYGDMITCTQ